MLQNKLHKCSFLFVYVVIITSVAVLGGWMFGIELLKRPFYTDVAMNPVSAILFVASGISFLLLTSKKRAYHVIGYALSVLIAIIALIKLVEFYTPLDWNIDAVLFRHKLLQDGVSGVTSGMTQGSAICFVFTGAFLFLQFQEYRASVITGQALIVLVLVIAWFVFIGYLYNVDIFYGVFTYIPMAIHAAICFLLIAAAALFVHPDRGMMHLLTGKYTGGVAARRLIPAAIIIPALLGFLRLKGHQMGLFTVEFGTTALVLSIMLVFMGIIWYNSLLLINREKENEKAQEALRYNNTLLQNISDAVFSTDMNLNIKTWNKHAEVLYGFRSAEVMGKELGKVLRIEYPFESMKAIGEKFMSKGYWTGELIHKTKTGGKLNVFISTSLLRDQAGAPAGTVTVARDITLRKGGEEMLIESELRLQTILDTYEGPIYARDQDGKYIVWNKGCEKITGYSLKQVKGKTVQELFPPDVAGPAQERDKEIFTSKKPIQYEWQWQRAGENKIFSIILFPMYNLKGELYGSCGLALDITARKKFEQNLREFNIELEKEVKQRTILLRELAAHLNTVRENERIEIAREIHDELGQQMTVLKMDISWLKKKLPDAEQEVSEKLNELIEMINQTIHTIRRIASELRPGVLDHLGITAAIEWQLKELEKRTDIKTTFTYADVPGALPEKVKTGVFRILQESLTNVARHANASSVEVDLTGAGKKLVLRITDNGDGFDGDKMTRKTLGLLGMKERASAMNGVYIIESEPGKGTTAKVEIELA